MTDEIKPANANEAIKAAVDAPAESAPETDDGWIKAAAGELAKSKTDDAPAPEPKDEPAAEPEAEAKGEPETPEKEPEKPKEPDPKAERRQLTELREKLLKRERKLAEREAAADARVKETMQRAEQATRILDRLKAKDYNALEELGLSLGDWQMRNVANPPSPEVGELRKLVEEMRAERQREVETRQQQEARQREEHEANQIVSQHMQGIEKEMANLPMCKRLVGKMEINNPLHPLQRAYAYTTTYAAKHGGVALDPADVAEYIERKLEEESKWFIDEPTSAARPPVVPPKAEPHRGRAPTNSDAGQSATPADDDDDATYIRKAAELLRRSAAGNSP